MPDEFDLALEELKAPARDEFDDALASAPLHKDPRIAEAIRKKRAAGVVSPPSFRDTPGRVAVDDAAEVGSGGMVDVAKDRGYFNEDEERGRRRRQAIDYATRLDGMTPTQALDAFERSPEAVRNVDEYLGAKQAEFDKQVRERGGSVRAGRVRDALLGPFAPESLRRAVVGGPASRETALEEEIRATQRSGEGFGARLLTEALPGAVGAAGRVLAGGRVVGPLPAAAVEGAAGAPEGERVKGAAQMTGLVALGGAGTRAMSKALPGPAAVRVPVAATVAGTGAELAVKGVSGDEVTADGLFESAVLNAVLGAPDIRSAARAEGFGRLRPQARENVMERRQATQDAETAKINAGDARRFGAPVAPPEPVAAPDAPPRTVADAGAPARTVPASAGARRFTAEGMARMEAAQEALREVIRNPDIVGRARADAIENGKNLVAFLQANGASKLETAYRNGDQIAYTGETTPDGFRKFIYLEGAKAGAEGAEMTTAERAAMQEQRRATEAEMQEGFRRLREPETPPPAEPPSMAAGGPTSVKNAVRDMERAERGVAPTEPPPRRSDAEVEAKVRDIIAKDPGRPERLVRELTEKPRALEDYEQVLLDTRMVDLNERYRLADEEVNAAAASGDPNRVAAAIADQTAIEQMFQETEAANRMSGSAETARSLRIRRLMMDRNHSLLAIQNRIQAAGEGKPLTAAERADVKELHARIERTDKVVARLEERFAAEEAGRALGKTAERVRTTKYGETNKGVTREAYEAAKARLRAKGLQLNALFDVTMIGDAVQMGAFHVEAGARGFARWAKKMTKEFGEQIKPHLRAIYAESLKQAPVVKDETGLSEAGKIAEYVMREEGVTGREAVITEVHNILKETRPETTRREVMDAISGYGKVRPLNPDPVKTELRELKGQMQQLAKLADMAEGRAPLRSGPERQAPGDEQRALIKQVNEAKRQGGYDVRDPASQLRSALDATKTRLTHEIADLDRQIAAGKRDIPHRTAAPTDAEVTALKAKRDALKAALDALDPRGVKARSDEAKIASAVEAVEKSIAGYEKRLQAGDIATRKQAPGPTNPALDALRAKRDALKKQLDDLRSATLVNMKRPLPHEVEAQRIKTALKAVERVTAEYERRVRTGDLEPKRKADEAFEARKQKMLAAARAKQDTARMALNEAIVRKRLQNRTFVQKAVDVGREVLNLPRHLMTALDFSAVLAQGGIHTLSHPIRSARALPAMFRAFRSKEGQARSEAEIRANPNYLAAKKAGVFFHEHGPVSLSQMEEAWMSRWVDKIPTVIGGGLLRGSQRAYTTFLNRIRMDAFDGMARSLSRTGVPTTKEAKAIADYINITTGRSTLGPNSVVTGLNTFLFAPRLMVSRFQFLGRALTAGQLGRGGSLRMRKMLAGEWARLLGGLGVVYGLGALAGGDIETDPRSSDFGKIRFGETRLDPLMGLQQAAVFLHRVIGGETKDKKGKVRDTDFQTVANFARSKLAPVPGAFFSARFGRKPTGEGTSWAQEGLDLITPMGLGDVTEAVQEQGGVKGSALGILTMLGMRLSTHQEDEKKGRK